ncbi:hypothetical protein TMatcc_000663 [Talaromyces marneffei ATCC 18224]|uniref:Uncharacterized protein n=1 Tax=Talaromyces marneffei PM1 TaxID=1077442 RepID=A0A093UT35_TALMA|nr:hypothetical protein EYB25_008163 [Talaromyces marneffei]
MAPNGGPSMASQARAAELNAAAAARARIMNGELSDFKPRSTPSQFSSSYTHNTEHVAVESFRRPNRPVDRYYQHVATISAPVTVYAYPQPQYADPRAVPAVYASSPYPAVPEYYQPVYQPIQSYQQVYPGYVNGYPLPTSPLPRGAIATATRQTTSRSAAASPTKPGQPQPVQAPDASPVRPQRGPSPVKNLSKGPSRSPSKSPVKKLDATPSPKKPPVEIYQYFTPDDLSPLKAEVEIMRFKAELEKIGPPKDGEKLSGNAKDKASPEKPPDKSVNEYEVDSHHHKVKDPEVDESEQFTPRAKKSGPSIVIQASNQIDQSAMEAYPEARKPPLTLEISPLTQMAYRNSMARMIQSYSFLPPGSMPRAEGREDIRLTTLQPQMFRVEEAHRTNPDKNMYQNDDGLFYVAQKTDEVVSEATPKAASRRLQSPFQLRPRLPVAYYKPIVNKYPRNVFASQQSRLDELWKVETGRAWLTFRQKPEVRHLPGSFKGFPRFPLIDENAQSPMNTGVLMPPPGFAVPGPILLSHSAHWNPESGSGNRATTYYDRVLAAEDWFHQSILKKKESTNRFQKKFTEVQSIILNCKDTFNNLPPSFQDFKSSQVTQLIKHVSENLISYTDTAETEKRGFEFKDIELGLENVLRRPKRARRKNRRAARRRNRGEFNIAPGSDLFDGVVVGSELPGNNDS